MRARDVMTRQVVCCSPTTSLEELAQAMRSGACGFVPVVEGGRLVGTVTDRDVCLLGARCQRPLGRIRASEIMSRDVHDCREEDDIATVHAAMRHHRVRRLPVRDRTGRLCGVISLDDLALDAWRWGDHDAGEAFLQTFVEVCAATERTHPAVPA